MSGQATELESVEWDLSHLLDGDGRSGETGDVEAVEELLDEASERSERFASAHAGRVAELDGPGLASAMEELAAIGDLASRAGSFAQLRFSTDTTDPSRGALLQRVQERTTEMATKLLFFDLEWAKLDDERAEELLAHEGLDFCRHHLRSERRYRPHLLSEPEEKLLTEKSVTGRSAWSRLFSELTSAIEVDLPDAEEALPLDVALARLHDPEREVRQTTAQAVTAALEPGLRTRAFILNTLVHDKAIDDRLRDYPHWLAARNLSNEASDESVAALIEAVQGRYELARRWYRLKAELLGLERLADYDRMAAVTAAETEVGWDDGQALVLDCLDSFDTRMGSLARRFFDERWIDAPPRKGKRGGAFCAYTVPSVHPYVLLNYTGRRRDVLTLAHELGHGLHAALAAPQGYFHQGTGLTMAETASVFAEEIVFGRLLDEAPDADSRLGLLAESIEGQIATVFRQVAMNRFEDRIHTARREEGELSVDSIGELWAGTQSDLLGDAVEITDGYRSWWSYVPHFISTPGYVYAYAFGQLLALSVYHRYREAGEAFVPRYLELLEAGGSAPPEELGAIVGVDLSDPGFWDAGLDLVAEHLELAEAAARTVIDERRSVGKA